MGTRTHTHISVNAVSLDSFDADAEWV